MTKGVIIVEDDARVRSAVRDLLATDDARDLALAGAAATVAEGLRALEAGAPDVLLLDLGLPDGRGTEVLAALPTTASTVSLVLTVFDDDEHVFEALRAGAVGYLLKDELVTRLLPSIREALAGGAPMNPGIARRVLQSFRAPSVAPTPRAPVRADEMLTEREREVVELLARGATYDDVARTLGISTNTVRAHVRATYPKLHATTRTEAMREAVRRGLIRWPF